MSEYAFFQQQCAARIALESILYSQSPWHIPRGRPNVISSPTNSKGSRRGSQVGPGVPVGVGASVPNAGKTFVNVGAGVSITDSTVCPKGGPQKSVSAPKLSPPEQPGAAWFLLRWWQTKPASHYKEQYGYVSKPRRIHVDLELAKNPAPTYLGIRIAVAFQGSNKVWYEQGST